MYETITIEQRRQRTQLRRAKESSVFAAALCVVCKAEVRSKALDVGKNLKRSIANVNKLYKGKQHSYKNKITHANAHMHALYRYVCKVGACKQHATVITTIKSIKGATLLQSCHEFYGTCYVWWGEKNT